MCKKSRWGWGGTTKKTLYNVFHVRLLKRTNSTLLWRSKLLKEKPIYYLVLLSYYGQFEISISHPIEWHLCASVLCKDDQCEICSKKNYLIAYMDHWNYAGQWATWTLMESAALFFILPNCLGYTHTRMTAGYCLNLYMYYKLFGVLHVNS